MTQTPAFAPEDFRVPGMWDVMLADPVLLAGSLLPIVLLLVMVWARFRAWRRVNTIEARTAQRFDQSAEQSAAYWRDAAERSERTIALLSEIRDLLSRMAPPPAHDQDGSGKP